MIQKLIEISYFLLHCTSYLINVIKISRKKVKSFQDIKNFYEFRRFVLRYETNPGNGRLKFDLTGKAKFTRIP